MKCIKTENLIGKMRPRYSVVKVLLQVELCAQTKSEEVSEDQKEGGWEGGGRGEWSVDAVITSYKHAVVFNYQVFTLLPRTSISWTPKNLTHTVALHY